jgi:serine/threonine-protein kinase
VVQSDPGSAAGVCEGDILAGKYRVERVLGVGGMGVVVAAHHLQLDEKVALKFLLPETLDNPEAVARFAREARALSKIKSEHIARVIDVGTLANGAPYMVMEYLDGVDLAAWLRRRGPLPVEQTVDFVLQTCLALADAHVLGIVHRDLKPANLFCIRRSDGQLSIKVLDFGISKFIPSGASPREPWVTETRAMMGSPLYMSPEQMESAKHVDAQTDIWAVGVILFELLTGRPVFLGKSVMEVAHKVANERTPSIRTFRRDVPSGLDAIVFKCLEKSRSERYRSVAELALDLFSFAPMRARASVEQIASIIQGAGLSTRAPVLGPFPQTTSTPPLERTTALPGNKAFAGAGLVGAAAVIAIVGSAFLVQRARIHRQDRWTGYGEPPSPAVSPQSALDSPKPSDPRRADALPPDILPVVISPVSSTVAVLDVPTVKRRKPPASVPMPVATQGDGNRPVASNPPSASAPSAESPSKEPVTLRSPQTRPKVQLDRDNPWR